MREVRLRFSKTGRLKYISHLDINRAMSRALKRAGEGYLAMYDERTDTPVPLMKTFPQTGNIL